MDASIVAEVDGLALAVAGGGTAFEHAGVVRHGRGADDVARHRISDHDRLVHEHVAGLVVDELVGTGDGAVPGALLQDDLVVLGGTDVLPSDRLSIVLASDNDGRRGGGCRCGSGLRESAARQSKGDRDDFVTHDERSVKRMND